MAMLYYNKNDKHSPHPQSWWMLPIPNIPFEIDEL